VVISRWNVVLAFFDRQRSLLVGGSFYYFVNLLKMTFFVNQFKVVRTGRIVLFNNKTINVYKNIGTNNNKLNELKLG